MRACPTRTTSEMASVVPMVQDSLYLMNVKMTSWLWKSDSLWHSRSRSNKCGAIEWLEGWARAIHQMPSTLFWTHAVQVHFYPPLGMFINRLANWLVLELHRAQLLRQVQCTCRQSITLRFPQLESMLCYRGQS